MGAVDRAWWRMHGPTTPLVITGVLMFDQRLDMAHVRDRVTRRIAEIDRFRDRVVRGDSRRPAWQPDPAFDTARHVRESTLPTDDEGALWGAIGALLGEPLDPLHPPWCIDVVHRPGAGSVLVARVHHAVGDGVALMLVLLALTDVQGDARDNPLAKLFRGDEDGPAAARRYVEDVLPIARKLLLRGSGLRPRGLPRALFRSAIDGARLALSRNDPELFASAHSPVRRVAWSSAVPMPELEDIAVRTGVTLNDVVLSAVCGALRRWAEQHAAAPLADIRAAVPVNLRALDRMARLGNRFGLLFVPLPLANADPIERLRSLRSRTRQLKRSGQPLATFALLQACGVGPHALTELVFRLFERKVRAVITNVPGPVRRLSLCGAEVSGIAFWVPTARTGLGIGIVSYADTVRIGVEADARLISDPEPIVRAFEDELRTLTMAATTKRNDYVHSGRGSGHIA